MSKFGALFGLFYGDHDAVELKHSLMWLFARVKDAAGIHFSSYKDDEEDKETEALKKVSKKNLFGQRVPPHLLAEMTHGRPEPAPETPT